MLRITMRGCSRLLGVSRAVSQFLQFCFACWCEQAETFSLVHKYMCVYSLQGSDEDWGLRALHADASVRKTCRHQKVRRQGVSPPACHVKRLGMRVGYFTRGNAGAVTSATDPYSRCVYLDASRPNGATTCPPNAHSRAVLPTLFA